MAGAAVRPIQEWPHLSLPAHKPFLLEASWYLLTNDSCHSNPNYHHIRALKGLISRL